MTMEKAEDFISEDVVCSGSSAYSGMAYFGFSSRSALVRIEQEI